MKRQTAERRVIWAVDPTAEDSKLQLKVFKTLTKMLPKDKVLIEPVTITSPAVRVPSASIAAFLVEQRNESEKLVQKWIKHLADKRICPATFLTNDGITTLALVRELLEYARLVKPDFIAVGTHSRKGLQRLFVGSFAETLLLHSEIPVLLINPGGKPPAQVKHILFATDFSATSQVAFDNVLTRAALLKAKVTVYSKIEYFVPQTYDLMKVSHYKDFLENDKKDRLKKGEQWAARAEAAGVKVSVHLDDRAAYIAEGILDFAKKKKANVVAMASSSGFWATSLVGSVVRKVVRLSPFPVWVIHPPTENTGAKKRKRGEPLESHRPRLVTPLL